MNLLWAGTKVSRVGRAVSAWVNMLATLWDARGCVASANVREGERSQHRRSVTMYGGGWKGARRRDWHLPRRAHASHVVV